jgi:glycosyltransferase involved in cell wall biosynthesis
MKKRVLVYSHDMFGLGNIRRMLEISTPISGIPELVEHGANGVLVPSRDSEALAGAIARLLGDPEEAARLGAAARRAICERFDSRRTTLTLRDLFLEAVR